MRIDAKNIFLIDGSGALLSSLSTGVVLPYFYQWTGIPTSMSSPLAVLGLMFAIFSWSCFWFVKKTKPWMLSAIIFANSFYCLLVLTLMITHNEINLWGHVFFAGEIFILAGVIFVECLVYRREEWRRG